MTRIRRIQTMLNTKNTSNAASPAVRIGRREFSQSLIVAGLSLASGCALPGNRKSSALPTRIMQRNSKSWRVLQRLTFGHSAGDVERISNLGYEDFIEEQLHPDGHDEQPALANQLLQLESLTLPPDELREWELQYDFDNSVTPVARKLLQLPNPDLARDLGPAATELQQATLLRAAYSRHQLREVMVNLWTNHFNIDLRKESCRWLKTVDDRRIRKLALGRFRDLLFASMTSPAMLVYLDAVEPTTGAANENYAREVLELHTLGVDAGYTLKDIQELAGHLSGWRVNNWLSFESGELAFDADHHMQGNRRIFGTSLSADGGIEAIAEIADLLANHPRTAIMVSRKICQRFVSDRPSSQLVNHLAGIYTSSGGEISTMITALTRRPEFWRPESQKLKRPFELVASAIRATGATTDGTGELAHLQAMGQPIMQWPLPDGFADSATAWNQAWWHRWNYLVALCNNDIPGCQLDCAMLVNRCSELDDASPVKAAVASWLHGTPTAAQSFASNSDAIPDAEYPEFAVALMLSAPQFQSR